MPKKGDRMLTKSRCRKPSNHDRAYFFEKFFMSYVFPVFLRGLRNNGLKFDDLDRCPKKDEVESNTDRLARNWNQDKNKKNPKFWWTLTRTFGPDFILPILAVLFKELVVRIAQALCFGMVVRHFSSPSEVSYHDTWYWASSVCLTALLIISILHPALLSASRIGLRLRVACCSLLYQKTLRLNQASLGQTAVGQMVNIMSNDVNRFDQFSLYLPFAFVAPIQTIMVVYIFWTKLGVYCFIGAALLLIFLPLQFQMARLFSRVRSKAAPLTDTRLRFMYEIISGMRVIKMYCWERPFAERIAQTRRKEVSQVRKACNLKSINLSVFFVATRILVFASFVAYVLSGETLTAETVFVAITLFNVVRFRMTYYFPLVINLAAELRVTCQRIQDILLLSENSTADYLDGNSNPLISPKTPDIIPESFVETMNGTIAKSCSIDRTESVRVIADQIGANWSSDIKQPTLKDVSLSLEPGDLLAVIGPVGSGKSSLLMALLGELPITSGDISQEGVLSYAGQESWIFNDTVRNNILFGLDYEPKRYHKVVKVCALSRDLELMPYGDRTLVGEKGVSLSGGQKSRINLARAVYRNADIYLLDDPLSAVDAAVAEHIFEKCILDNLRCKIRILVTHQIQFIQKATKILVLKDGQSVAYGSYEQLRHQGIDFLSLLTTDDHEPKENVSAIPESRSRNVSILSYIDLFQVAEDNNIAEVKEEQLQRGSIKWKVYLEYLRAGSSVSLLIVVAISTILSQSLLHGSDIFLAYWTNNSHDVQLANQNTDVLIYTCLIVALFVTTVARAVSFFSVCMRASETLHNQIFSRLLRAPVSFFDSTPSGQILNRFSKDLGIVDEMLPSTGYDNNQNMGQAIGSMVTVAIVSWTMVLPGIVLWLVTMYFRKLYIISARDIKRLEAIARSPVYSHLNTTVNGLTTIRAFGVQSTFERQFDIYQNDHSATWFMYLSTSRALGLIIDAFTVIYLGVVTLNVMLTDGLPGGSVGLSITSALMLCCMVPFLVDQMSEFESQMTSVERIVEYKNLELESNAESSEDMKPEEMWPAKGEIQFDDMSLVYGDNQKPVLRNLNCRIGGGEKIGIVGRTGAGKSSMIAALFRLTEPRGVIRIDGVDIQSIGLDDLRQKISIIPQDPVIYSGTIRYNLDPFGQYDDSELWAALDQVQLKSSVNNFAEKLDAQLSESGGNLSVGQRQLICLARAILRRNRILVLDEATANIDHQTDSLIQDTIRSQFGACTVLTIAHRLNTIIDSDRVLVLDAGKILEFDAPYLLLERTGIFFDMCQKTGPKMYSQLLRMAKAAYQNTSN